MAVELAEAVFARTLSRKTQPLSLIDLQMAFWEPRQ
jgi:hypothetical protein